MAVGGMGKVDLGRGICGASLARPETGAGTAFLQEKPRKRG